MISNKFKLLFFGSDNFSIRVLDKLINNNLRPAGVVTSVGSPLDRFSVHREFDIHRWPIETSIIDKKAYNIGLVASFGHLINPEIVENFKYGLFNIHPSLLPQFRGSSPVQAAILNDLKETGCTIMQIKPVNKFDVGDIILQEKMLVKNGEYAFELSTRLADLGSDLTHHFLSNYDLCMGKSRPQTNHARSYAKKIKPDEGRIHFRSDSSSLIDKKVRAFTGTIDIYTSIHGKEIKLEAMRELTEIKSLNLDRAMAIHYELEDNIYPLFSPGRIFFHKPRHLLSIKAADGCWLAFDFMTPVSRPQMTSLEFYNGYLSNLDRELLVTDL